MELEDWRGPLRKWPFPNTPSRRLIDPPHSFQNSSHPYYSSFTFLDDKTILLCTRGIGFYICYMDKSHPMETPHIATTKTDAPPNCLCILQPPELGDVSFWINSSFLHTHEATRSVPDSALFSHDPAADSIVAISFVIAHDIDHLDATFDDAHPTRRFVLIVPRRVFHELAAARPPPDALAVLDWPSWTSRGSRILRPSGAEESFAVEAYGSKLAISFGATDAEGGVLFFVFDFAPAAVPAPPWSRTLGSATDSAERVIAGGALGPLPGEDSPGPKSIMDLLEGWIDYEDSELDTGGEVWLHPHLKLFKDKLPPSSLLPFSHIYSSEVGNDEQLFEDSIPFLTLTEDGLLFAVRRCSTTSDIFAR